MPLVITEIKGELSPPAPAEPLTPSPLLESCSPGISCEDDDDPDDVDEETASGGDDAVEPKT